MPRFSELLDEFFYRPDEDPGPLLELGAVPDPGVPPAVEPPSEEFLGFRLEGEHYAVPLREVREIIKVPPLTEIPRGPGNLLGVVNLRGEVLPVYDVKVRLHLAAVAPKIAGPPGETTALPRRARILMIRAAEGAGGVLVDEVTEVLRIRPSAIEAPPPGLGERECVVGIGRRMGQLYILIDIHQAIE